MIKSTEKIRAPRNQTLTLTPSQIKKNLSEVLSGESLFEDLFYQSIDHIQNKIIQGNTLEVLKKIPSDTFDLIIADPPYNLSKQYSSSSFKKQGENEYELWCDQWMPELFRVLKINGSAYICCDWQSSQSIYQVGKKYFNIKNRITWEREKGRGAQSNWKNCIEDIWFFTKSEDYYFNLDAVKVKKKVIAPYKTKEGKPKDWSESSEGNYRLTHPSNVWTDITIPFWSMPENTDHPTQKSEKLLAKMILASSKEGDLVFDPFLGSGTTAVVSKKLGRKYCGIEKEDLYCALTIERIKSAENNPQIQGFEGGVFWERNSKISH